MRETVGTGALWLLCAAMGTAGNLDLWPAMPIVVVVTAGRLAWDWWRR